MNFPNLFILGAPKCGTTALYHWLSQNPSIATPRTKEPHFFYNPYGRSLEQKTYLEMYENIPGDFSYYLEASVWYLFSGVAAAKISSQIPEAKFIVCLRNPIEMAPSLHYQKLFVGHESEKDFEQAWRLDNVRSQGNFTRIVSLPGNADARHMAYKHACMLGAQTEKLLQQVERSQVFFCFIEDMEKRPSWVYSKICNFLELEENDIEFSVKNTAKRLRSPILRETLEALKSIKRLLRVKRRTGYFAWVHRANRVQERYKQPSPEIVKEMQNAFRSDIALLERLTSRNLSHWLE